MGIPYYFYTIYKKYSNANIMISEHDIANQNVEHLFFDYNSMIHPCAHQALTCLNPDEHPTTEEIEEEIIKACISYTRYVLNLLKPKHAYVMIDGVAPRGKIVQQRERRYKSHFFKHLNTEAQTVVNWDTNKITPGTGFMAKMSELCSLVR